MIYAVALLRKFLDYLPGHAEHSGSASNGKDSRNRRHVQAPLLDTARFSLAAVDRRLRQTIGELAGENAASSARAPPVLCGFCAGAALTPASNRIPDNNAANFIQSSLNEKEKREFGNNLGLRA